MTLKEGIAVVEESTLNLPDDYFDLSLEAVRAAKLAELDAAAQTAITGGCDVALADGTTGHISLTAEDQINLSTAQAAVQAGAAGYPYHLDGELCKIYAAADILSMSGLTSTADWLVGQNITGAGKLLGQDWSNNPVSALNRRMQQAKETNENYFVGNVKAGGKAAAAVDKYGTMPLTNIADSVKGVAQAVKNGAKPDELAMAGLDLGAQLLPGGRQLQKTAQGIQTIANGGRVYGYGDNKRLQYPVTLDPVKGVQLLAFGNSGVSESRDFYAGDQKGLTQRQTQLVQGMAADGADRREGYQTIQQIRGGKNTTQKMQALNRADLSDLEKLKLYSGVIASGDSGVPEKFQNLMGKRMSWNQITGAYTMRCLYRQAVNKKERRPDDPISL